MKLHSRNCLPSVSQLINFWVQSMELCCVHITCCYESCFWCSIWSLGSIAKVLSKTYGLISLGSLWFALPMQGFNVIWPQRFMKLTSTLFGAGELLQTNMLIYAIHESWQSDHSWSLIRKSHSWELDVIELSVNSTKVLVRCYFLVSVSFWCMLGVGVNDFLYKFIEGQTHFGMPSDVKMNLALNEPI